MRKTLTILAIITCAFMGIAHGRNVGGNQNFKGDVNLDGRFAIKGVRVTATAAQLNQTATGTLVLTNTLTVAEKATFNGETEMNAVVDINFTLPAHIFTLDQTNGTGTADTGLATITDARTGATANTAGEATIKVGAAGTHAVYVSAGKVELDGELEVNAATTMTNLSLDIGATLNASDGTVSVTNSAIDFDASTISGDVVASGSWSLNGATNIPVATALIPDGVLPALDVSACTNGAIATLVNSGGIAPALDLSTCTNGDLSILVNAGDVAPAIDISAATNGAIATLIVAGGVMPATDISLGTNANASAVFGSGTVPLARLNAALQAIGLDDLNAATNIPVATALLPNGVFPAGDGNAFTNINPSGFSVAGKSGTNTFETDAGVITNVTIIIKGIWTSWTTNGVETLN